MREVEKNKTAVSPGQTEGRLQVSVVQHLYMYIPASRLVLPMGDAAYNFGAQISES
jgi:hypothetical protein